MAENKALGNDYVLFVDTDTTGVTPAWKAVVCESSLSLEESNDTVDASSKCGSDILVGRPTNSVSVEGFALESVDAGSGHIAWFDLNTLVTTANDTNKTLAFKIAPKVAEAGKFNYAFDGRVTSITTNFNDQEAVNVSLSISVKGNVTKTITTAP